MANANVADRYTTELEAWKRRAGFRDISSDCDVDEQTLIAADAKLPGSDHCVICGKGPQLISEMQLITEGDDPHIQSGGDIRDPENRVRACPECWDKVYGPASDEAEAD